MLEGSIRRSGNNIRVTGQLIRSSDQTHLWAQSYDGDLGDVLKLESNIALEVAGQIRLALSEETHERLKVTARVNPEAHDAYLRGLEGWNQRNPQGFHEAIAEFTRATELSPDYAVHSSGKSHYKAVIVTPEQAFTILMTLPESERVLTLVIAATGLRISEALGLQWQDVDYANQRINLRRVWLDNKVVERMKTEQSEAPATMSPTLAEVLKCWHRQTSYAQPNDWIFASSRLN